MIQSIYVLRLNGVLLYSYHATQQLTEDIVFSGFFASIANFSQEALNVNIERVDLGADRKLVIYKSPDADILYTAIVPERDDVRMVKSLLVVFAEAFNSTYGPAFLPKKINENEARLMLEKVIKEKIIHRSFSKSILIYLLTIASLFLNGFLLYLFTEWFYSYQGLPANAKISMEINSIFLVYLAVIAAISVFLLFPGSGFLLGYFMGELKTARKWLNLLGLMVAFEAWLWFLRDTLFWVYLFFVPLGLVLLNYSATLGAKYCSATKIDSRLE